MTQAAGDGTDLNTSADQFSGAEVSQVLQSRVDAETGGPCACNAELGRTGSRVPPLVNLVLQT